MAGPVAGVRWWCGLVGLAGSVCVVAGASQPSSPFAVKLPDAWYFGLRGSGDQWLGLLLVWGGVLMLLAGWYGIVRCGAAKPAHLWMVWAAWTAPLVVGPPLFSRDVYAYVAEGRLADLGASPYTHGPAFLGRSPSLTLVDPLWRTSHAPYGPFFLDLAGLAARAGLPASVLVLRLLAVVGVALIGAAVVPLARSTGRDPGRAFALAVLNPLVLLYLVGGAHNDALMLGLLVAGVAVGRRFPVAGVLLCALAASVKLPAAIGIVYVGWDWGIPIGRRCLRLLAAAALGAAAMVAVSAASGFGWGWLTNLSAPGTVVSWLDPATAVGRAVGEVTVARALALVVAAGLSVVLLARSDRIGAPAAIGWSLLAFALLGPVVWPWYETWGLVFLAVAGAPKIGAPKIRAPTTDRAGTVARRVVLVLSAVGCFATVPPQLHLSTGGTLAVVVALAVVAAALVAFLVRLAGWPPSSWSTGPCTAGGAGATSAGG